MCTIFKKLTIFVMREVHNKQEFVGEKDNN